MTYISLARKYRPAKFADLVGQDSVATSLRNAISLNREPHAAIFTGSRGIGKTTIARLYAKALNCTNSLKSEPCNQCESCQYIADSTHEDVMEIDGASHTGIDDIRQLQESLMYVPQRSKYRIFIIDEVHMLSQSAFNALLKTLEEPPGHVVFIFATTELSKVPDTILSRCQVFFLQLISVNNILTRLKGILTVENIGFEESALRFVAEHGRGSLRDALTYLDQVIALGDGSVDEKSVAALFSPINITEILNFHLALLTKDAALGMNIIETWEQTGTSYKFMLEQACQYTRHAMIIQNLGRNFSGLNILNQDIDRIKHLLDEAAPVDATVLNRIFRFFMGCQEEVSGSNLDRFVLENNFLEWCLGADSKTQGNFADTTPSTPIKSNDRASNLPHSLIQEPVILAPTEGIHSAKVPGTVSKFTVENLRASLPSALLGGHNKPMQQAPLENNYPQPSQVLSQKAPIFPESWASLIEIWMSKKTLEARRLESCNIQAYSSDEIKLGTPLGSMETPWLMQPLTQKTLLAQLHSMFGFNGKLTIIEIAPEECAEDNLLLSRMRDKNLAREALIKKTKESPLTLSALKILNAEIEHVELLEE